MPAYFRWVDAQRAKVTRAVVGWFGRGLGGVGQNSNGKREQLYNIRQPFSRRLRAGATYCSGCNSVFLGLPRRRGQARRVVSLQSLLPFALGAAEPGIRLQTSRTRRKRSNELNIHQCASRFTAAVRSTSFTISFSSKPLRHGRCSGECHRAADGPRWEEILPDVPVKCEPILARRWSKQSGQGQGQRGTIVSLGAGRAEEARLS